MPKRRVLMDRDWLRRYLRDHHAVSVSMTASDEEWQRICNEIPSQDWTRLKGAWHRYRHQVPSRYTQYVHAANEERKRLGLFWQRLIDQGFISEEDALLLAEHFFPGPGGYSDEMAKDMVRKILSGVADRYRTAQAANRQTKFGRRRTDFPGGSALKV